MWPQLYGVCYCLSNSCAIVFRHNRSFDYQPQFRDRQKPHPLTSRRAVRIRHYRPKIKSQNTARSVAIREQTELMLKQNIIEPTVKGWTSNLVLVRENDNKLKFCVDY